MKIGICIFIFLFLPIYGYAQTQDQIILSKKDSETILQAVQHEISIGSSSLNIFDYSAKQQAALTIFRDSTRKAVLDFLPGFVSTETVKIVLSLANEFRNLPQTAGDLIGKLEDLSAKEAAKIGLDWLSKNEIKVGSGNIDGKYPTYNGTVENAHFQYLVSYKKIDQDNADVIVEFYSPNLIDAPSFHGSAGGFLGFVGDSRVDGKIDPFVVHIEGRISRITLGWAIDSSAQTKISVEFPEKVPRLELSPELPYPLEEQKINLLNYLNTLKGIANTLGITGSQAWQRISKIGDAAQEVAKKIELIQMFISKFTPKNTGAGIALLPQVSESSVAKASKVPVQSATLHTSQGAGTSTKTKTATKNSSASAKSADAADASYAKVQPLHDKGLSSAENAAQEIVRAQQAPAEEILPTPNAQTAQTNSSLGTAHSCAVFSDSAPQQNSVIFNEIAWMGTPDSSGNEWMELKNVSGLPISLTGWQVINKNEKIKIDFANANTILPGQFFLLERTDDSSVPYVAADLIYSNAISNAKDELYIFDSNCVMRDKIVASPNWPAGDSSQKRSMERWADLTWHTYAGVLQGGVYGTPRAENISNGPVFLNVASGIGSGGGTSTADASSKKAYPKILISEVQIAGIDSQTEEFVELYNPTGSDVDLTDWHIQKKTKSAASFSTFVSSNSFSGKTIKALGYFLIARANSSFAASADITTQSSLAEDNMLALKNPNQEIVDKVGWGASRDFETQAVQNPPAGKSIGRKYQSGSYTDTDDNSKDFEIQTPSPKLVNENYIGEAAPPQAAPLSSETKDTTPPAVAFDTVAPSQTNTSFILSWTAEDLLGTASPSGIDGFYLQYSVTPSADGIFLRYENNDSLAAWNQGQAGELNFSPSTTAVTVSAQDGIGYVFLLKAKDKAANQSAPVTASTEVSLAKTIVINEIAWAGTKASATDEWLELYNNTGSPVNMAGWKLKSADGNPSFALAGTIDAGGYYLLERTNDSTINDTAANQIYTGALGNDGENLGLYDAQDNLIDAVDASSAWFSGDNTTKQSMERIDSAKSGSDKNNWLNNNLIKHNGKDAASNFINGTPKQQNSVSVLSTQIADLRFSEFGNSLTLPLRGSPYFTDGITVPENAMLTIEPGVTVKFKNNYAQFIVDGTLKAVGSGDKKITFTTDSNNGGSWCGLSFTSKSKNSDLEYVTIDQASRTSCGGSTNYAMLVEASGFTFKNSSITGGNGIRKLYLKGSNSSVDAVTISGAAFDQNSSAVFIDGGSPTIQNSTFSSNSIGIYSTAQTAIPGTPTIKNNTFSQNTYPIRFDNPSISLSGNTATQNTHNGIYVEGAVSYADAVWQADLPYIVESFTVNAGKKITLQPGVAVKFADFSHGNREIIVNGTLLAQGTSEKPITFTADSSISDWRRIDFAPGSAGSILQNAIIQNGGSLFNGRGGALYIETSDVQIQNVSIVLQSYEYGFYVSSACPAISGVTIQGGTMFSPAGRSCAL